MQNKYLTFRKKNGASRNDIARATGITPRTIYNIEHDLFNPSLSTLAKMADYYGLSVADFVKAVS